MRAIENAETPRSPEWLQNLTDQQQKTASPVVPSFPLSLSSSSDSNSESSSGSSDSEYSESAVNERSRQRSTNRNLRNQVTPSLREWGDWKREIGKQPTLRPEEGAEELQDQEMEQVPGVDEEEDLRMSNSTANVYNKRV
jgi:hypothetical protein